MPFNEVTTKYYRNIFLFQNQLKNILSVMLSRRNGYRVREKRFKYAMGSDMNNPYIRHVPFLGHGDLEK